MKLLLLTLLAAFTASAQVVFVDMATLVQRHPRTANDKAALEKRLAEMEADVAKLKAELEAMNADFEAAVKEAQNPAHSASAKKKAEEAVEDKRERLVERERQAATRVNFLREELADQEERYLKRTTDEIRDHIGLLAKEKGYKAVLPKTLAVYAEPNLDITEEVAKKMQLPPLPATAK